ncbi:MAG: sulfurtransferase TusA family protein [Deltaproteobacteria bacterium]|nr:sulfurtransferase TusA family protein [Deltaproteobacteria bacterium]
MPEEITVEKVMDLKGLPCPMPVVKVSKGIKEVEIGQVIEAHSTDPGALTDFPAWARTSGNEILKTLEDGDVIKFFIKRNA